MVEHRLSVRSVFGWRKNPSFRLAFPLLCADCSCTCFQFIVELFSHVVGACVPPRDAKTRCKVEVAPFPPSCFLDGRGSLTQDRRNAISCFDKRRFGILGATWDCSSGCNSISCWSQFSGDLLLVWGFPSEEGSS